MGTLSYSTMLSVNFDDWVLSHLQVVIGAKLRRGESFYFSWKGEDSIDGGRTTVWLHPTVPLSYTYTAAAMPMLNREWLETLSVSANSTAGLQIVPEPVPAGSLANR